MGCQVFTGGSGGILRAVQWYWWVIVGFFLEVLDDCGILHKLQWVVVGILRMKRHLDEIFIK